MLVDLVMFFYQNKINEMKKKKMNVENSQEKCKLPVNERNGLIYTVKNDNKYSFKAFFMIHFQHFFMIGGFSLNNFLILATLEYF